MIANDHVLTSASGRGAKEDSRHAVALASGRINRDQRRQAYRIALALALICFLAAAPAYWHLRLSSAPDWGRILLLGSLWQLAFVAWMATIPDRSSIWVLMLVFAIAATSYAAVASIMLLTPDEFDLPLNLTEARWPAFWWSSLVAVLSAAVAFFCGHTAQRWRNDES